MAAAVRMGRSCVKRKIKPEFVDAANITSTAPNQKEKKMGQCQGKHKAAVKVKVEDLSSGHIGKKPKAAVKQKKSRVKKEVYSDVIGDVQGQSAGVSGPRKFVGAHLSIIGGMENTVYDAKAIGASAFGLFLKSQRTWKSKPLEDDAAERFISAYKEHGISPWMILPHGSYLLNCGAPNNETLLKSRDGLVDELRRCDKLGLPLFNFHPGSTCGEITLEECVGRIAVSINLAHAQSKHVTTVIENMSCQGHTVGGRFEELRSIIDQVKDQTRVGVCLDTCHAFAAGYNMATEEGYEKMMTDFENIIGLQYLKAVHLNDSMGDVGCHKDRHENIGRGKIGLEGFRRLMNDPRFNDIPMILETPAGQSDLDEIKILHSLCKK